MLRFLLNNEPVQYSPQQADLTVLEYLREQRKLTGSKEGCASGDCGACTVVLAEVSDTEPNKLSYRSINSCITFMSALQGKQLITIEHLTEGKQLHPVQQSLVNHHGSQCGFCTPGFIMSMFSLYHQPGTPSRETVNHALSGNLCRCTGYRPIIDATLHACANKQADQFARNEAQTLAHLQDLQASEQQHLLLSPHDRQALKAAIAAHPEASLFAGSTDLALQVTQQLKQFTTLISLSRVAELRQLHLSNNALVIGAALPLSDIELELLQHFPQLSELFSRFASLPVRNQATLGGNVANASPIGDMPPVLLALNARLILDNGERRREVPVSEFFIAYRQTSLQPGEWIEAIVLPLPAAGSQLRAYKISKRMEDDISAVCAVFNLQLDNGKVADISCGFGGVAATPASVDLYTKLTGKNWSEAATLELALEQLGQAFSPIDDVRATKEYRQRMLVNLLRRFWLETNSHSQAIATRVVQLDHTEAGHA